jgi:hypothetical protein
LRSGRPSFLAALETARELTMAKFPDWQLGVFAAKHVLSHDDMKAVVRDWLLRQGVDGILRVRASIDELIFARPQRDLRILTAEKL